MSLTGSDADPHGAHAGRWRRLWRLAQWSCGIMAAWLLVVITAA